MSNLCCALVSNLCSPRGLHFCMLDDCWLGKMGLVNGKKWLLSRMFLIISKLARVVCKKMVIVLPRAASTHKLHEPGLSGLVYLFVCFSWLLNMALLRLSHSEVQVIGRVFELGRAVITKYHRLGGRNNRSTFLPSSGV